MKTKAFALLVLPFGLLLSTASNAAPTIQAPSGPVPQVGTLKAKAVPKLQMQDNVVVTAGDTRNIEASLLGADGKPLKGKKVSFTIVPKAGGAGPVPPKMDNMGTDSATNEAGKAKVSWTPPELKAGQYTIRAMFGGDDEFMGAVAEANLVMIQGVVNVVLDNLMWSNYDGEKSSYGSFTVKLIRLAGHTPVEGKIRITQVGAGKTSSQVISINGTQQFAVDPSSAPSWKVTVDYEGKEGVYAPFHAERTYVRPH